MDEAGAILEILDLLKETAEHILPPRFDQILQNTGSCFDRGCLSHMGHVVQTQVKILGHVKLIELIDTYQISKTCNLSSKLLPLSPIRLIFFL